MLPVRVDGASLQLTKFAAAAAWSITFCVCSKGGKSGTWSTPSNLIGFGN